MKHQYHTQTEFHLFITNKSCFFPTPSFLHARVANFLFFLLCSLVVLAQAFICRGVLKPNSGFRPYFRQSRILRIQLPFVFYNTVGIWLTDVSGNRMAIISPLTEWSGNRMPRLRDYIYLFRPFSYRTKCQVIQGPYKRTQTAALFYLGGAAVDELV